MEVPDGERSASCDAKMCPGQLGHSRPRRGEPGKEMGTYGFR
jgi:hypothetical protein